MIYLFKFPINISDEEYNLLFEKTFKLENQKDISLEIIKCMTAEEIKTIENIYKDVLKRL